MKEKILGKASHIYVLGCAAAFSVLNVSSIKTGAMHDSVLGPLCLTQCLT